MPNRPVHPAIAHNASRHVDVRCVFDTTGSMSNKIASLVESVAEIVASLGRLQLDWRFGVVPFGDLTVPGDRIVTDLPECLDVASAQTQLRSLPRFSGGGNIGESSGDAMLAALERPFRPNAVKVVVLITDEPALGGPPTAARVDQLLTAMDALCFTIAPDFDYFRAWAERHGGTWQLIGPAIDALSLMQMFDDMMAAAVQAADSVHTDHGGSVRRYLSRARPEAQRSLRRSDAAPEGRGRPSPLPPPARRQEPRQLTRAVDERALPPAPPDRRLGSGGQ